jgi:hypothetical protein
MAKIATTELIRLGLDIHRNTISIATLPPDRASAEVEQVPSHEAAVLTVVPHGARRWTRCSSHFAQQMRSSSALRTRTNHHTPALLLWCNGLLREGSSRSRWRGSLDGMQGVRGSNPLSSTRHNASAARPLRVVCQQIVSRSLHVTSVSL